MKISARRITLRDWVPGDAQPYRAWMREGQAWQRLDGPYYPKPSPEEVEQLLLKREERISKADWPTPRTALAVADAADDRLLGQVSWYWQSRETLWLSVGIALYDPEVWGKGLGYEALGHWCEYLFGAMPEIVRLDLRTWSGNVGMMRLAEKLGFSLEARFRKARVVEGEYYDGLGYGVLREEWRSRHPGGFAARR